MQNHVTALDVIDVASPCPADWEGMTGDERVRHCSQCDLNVYNLSDMTEDEALRLVNENEGRLCIRFFRRMDGTMITRDCPVGLVAVRRKIARLWAGAAAMVGAIIWGGLFGRSAAAGEPSVPKEVLKQLEKALAERPEIKVTEIQGRMCVTPPKVELTQLVNQNLPPETIIRLIKSTWQQTDRQSLGQPDPMDTTAMPEQQRQEVEQWLGDPTWLCPQAGSNEHRQLQRYWNDFVKKHPQVAAQLLRPQIPRREILGVLEVRK